MKNPIAKTIVVILLWFVLALIVALFFVEDVSEKPFAVIIFFIYAAPAISIVVWVFNILRNRNWIGSHMLQMVVFSLILLVWFVSVLIYVHNLFM